LLASIIVEYKFGTKLFNFVSTAQFFATSEKKGYLVDPCHILAPHGAPAKRFTSNSLTKLTRWVGGVGDYFWKTIPPSHACAPVDSGSAPLLCCPGPSKKAVRGAKKTISAFRQN